jgi:hypothetical protein
MSVSSGTLEQETTARIMDTTSSKANIFVIENSPFHLWI